MFTRIYAKTTRPDFSTNFLYVLPVAMTRSCSDGIVIRYVLPVLWMTSRFHIIKPVGKNQARRYVSSSSQVAAPAAKSAISDCILLAV